jgi:hypothetical protein
MRKRSALCSTAIFGLFLLLASGCGNKAPGRVSGSGSSPSRSASSGRSDYSQPALTEQKMARFLESMQEEKNPLEFIFKPGGQMRGFADMKNKEAELNAYSVKCGFSDYREYIDTWGRVTVGEIQLSAAKMMKGLSESTEKTVKAAEEKLKEPSLTAEQRQMYTEQIEQGRKSIADLTKSNSGGLNAADLALVEKYAPQLDAAAKKHRAM